VLGHFDQIADAIGENSQSVAKSLDLVNVGGQSAFRHHANGISQLVGSYATKSVAIRLQFNAARLLEVANDFPQFIAFICELLDFTVPPPLAFLDSLPSPLVKLALCYVDDWFRHPTHDRRQHVSIHFHWRKFWCGLDDFQAATGIECHQAPVLR
jgi:hypothetical protein